MKIIFRVDGGEGIGLGHIMRTLVLAKQLKNQHDVKYVCLNVTEYIKGIEKIKNENIEVITICKENELEEIKWNDADVIVIDKYNIDIKYLLQLKSNFKVVCFDDNATLQYYPVDMIINQNVYGKEVKYDCLKNTKLLLGSNYTMLREEFRNNMPIKIKESIKDLFITVGGSDDFNITEKIINQLKDLSFNLHIIVGSAFKFKKTLQEYKSSSILLYENINMSEIMKKCDVAISTCGSTIYELSFLGVPTLGIIIADNQIRCGEHMNKIGAIKLSELENLKEDILNLDYNKRLKMSKIQHNLVDGKGSSRVKNQIEMYDKYK